MNEEEILVSQVLSYNHSRYVAYFQDLPFIKNPEFEKILNARYCKVSRIKKRLLYLFTRYKYIWFCTFTFDDYYLYKSSRTKKDLIKSVLNTHDFKYILNIDYGKQNHREHYHCIVATNIDFDVNQYFQDFYPCFSLSINCKNGLNDFKRLSKYINKLINHCVKATTNRQRLIYNFKGYDNFCPTSRDKTIMYNLDYERFFNT